MIGSFMRVFALPVVVGQAFAVLGGILISHAFGALLVWAVLGGIVGRLLGCALYPENRRG